MKILIADDELVSRAKLGCILKDFGECIEVENGEQAMKIACSAPFPDLILLDVMMPGMNGYDTCEELKRNPETKHIPIIFITALMDQEDEVKGFQCGASDFIKKPFAPDIVKARVSTLLEIKKYRDNLELLVSERTKELEEAYENLKSTHEQILQQEKLASIGQLAAGVAHEINNPTGFISSNLGTLAKYLDKIETFIQEISNSVGEEHQEKVTNLRKKLKIDFLLEDIRDLVSESLEGTDGIKKIVMGLKNFSRKDQDTCISANINECMENTLNVIWNELKYKATVQKQYGELNNTKCYPQQLNQVFMNLLVNAAHAIEEKGDITIKTMQKNGTITVSIADTGCGISQENLQKIFNPFFTTKEVGKGTGLGMSIATDIVNKHNGELSVESELGKGSTFFVKLPVVEE